MKKILIFGAASIVTIMLLIMDTSAAKADVTHCGSISSNETWAASDNVHIVNCDVTVPSGITLTIEAGVIVKFEGDGPGTFNGTAHQTNLFVDNRTCS